MSHSVINVFNAVTGQGAKLDSRNVGELSALKEWVARHLQIPAEDQLTFTAKGVIRTKKTFVQGEDLFVLNRAELRENALKDHSNNSGRRSKNILLQPYPGVDNDDVNTFGRDGMLHLLTARLQWIQNLLQDMQLVEYDFEEKRNECNKSKQGVKTATIYMSRFCSSLRKRLNDTESHVREINTKEQLKSWKENKTLFQLITMPSFEKSEKVLASKMSFYDTIGGPKLDSIADDIVKCDNTIQGKISALRGEIEKSLFLPKSLQNELSVFYEQEGILPSDLADFRHLITSLNSDITTLRLTLAQLEKLFNQGDYTEFVSELKSSHMMKQQSDALGRIEAGTREMWNLQNTWLKKKEELSDHALKYYQCLVHAVDRETEIQVQIIEILQDVKLLNSKSESLVSANELPILEGLKYIEKLREMKWYRHLSIEVSRLKTFYANFRAGEEKRRKHWMSSIGSGISGCGDKIGNGKPLSENVPGVEVRLVVEKEDELSQFDDGSDLERFASQLADYIHNLKCLNLQGVDLLEKTFNEVNSKRNISASSLLLETSRGDLEMRRSFSSPKETSVKKSISPEMSNQLFSRPEHTSSRDKETIYSLTQELTSYKQKVMKLEHLLHQYQLKNTQLGAENILSRRLSLAEPIQRQETTSKNQEDSTRIQELEHQLETAQRQLKDLKSENQEKKKLLEQEMETRRLNEEKISKLEAQNNANEQKIKKLLIIREKCEEENRIMSSYLSGFIDKSREMSDRLLNWFQKTCSLLEYLGYRIYFNNGQREIVRVRSSSRNNQRKQDDMTMSVVEENINDGNTEKGEKEYVSATIIEGLPRFRYWMDSIEFKSLESHESSQSSSKLSGELRTTSDQQETNDTVEVDCGELNLLEDGYREFMTKVNLNFNEVRSVVGKRFKGINIVAKRNIEQVKHLNLRRLCIDLEDAHKGNMFLFTPVIVKGLRSPENKNKNANPALWSAFLVNLNKENIQIYVNEEGMWINDSVIGQGQLQGKDWIVGSLRSCETKVVVDECDRVDNPFTLSIGTKWIKATVDIIYW